MFNDRISKIYPSSKNCIVILFYSTLEHGEISIKLKTNLESSFAISISYDLSPIDKDDGIVYAALILLGLYVLIIFEVIRIIYE